MDTSITRDRAGWAQARRRERLDRLSRYRDRVATIEKELSFRVEWGFRLDMRDIPDDALQAMKRSYERGLTLSGSGWA